LLSTLHEARATRVFFAPGEVGQAFEGEEARPLDGDPVPPSVLVEAALELLSQDEIRSLPSNRPRIVRHEHDGADYVIEVVRQPGGVALGVRLAKSTLRRDAPESSRDPLRDSVRRPMEPEPARRPMEPEPLTGAAKRPAPAPAAMEPEPLTSLSKRAAAPPPAAPPPAPAPAPAEAEEAPVRRGSRRFRAPREKHTIRVDLDEEGVPLDATAIDLHVSIPNEPVKQQHARRSSKGFKRPTINLAKATDRTYETRIVPRAGQAATNTEIAGAPTGAYVTFLFAPSGFSLVMEGEGAVVMAKTDDAAVRGELYVAPSMKLRIAQGPKESIVTFYRRSMPG
jgi:hypothetical protein